MRPSFATARLVLVPFGLLPSVGCGALILESEFGGRWRIAEHTVELADGDVSVINPGFFDCNASFTNSADPYQG